MFKLFKQNKTGKSAQDSIPFLHIYKNGVIETEPGAFCAIFSVGDINFIIAPQVEQEQMYKKYEAFINSFHEDTEFQVLIWNHKMKKKDTMRRCSFEMQDDPFNQYRSEINGVLAEKISEGRSSIQQEKFLIIKIQDNSVSHAMDVINTKAMEIERLLHNISKKAVVERLSAEKVIPMLFNIYNQDGESRIENRQDEKGEWYFSLDEVHSDPKNLISAMGMEFNDNYLKVGQTYGRAMVLKEIAGRMDTDFMRNLTSINAEFLTSIQLRPLNQKLAIQAVHNHLTDIDGEIALRQSKNAEQGISGGLIPISIRAGKEAAEDLMQDILHRDQRLIDTTFLVTVFGKTKKELDEVSRLVTSSAEDKKCAFRTLLYQQEQGFTACLPFVNNQVRIKKTQTAESAAIFVPFTSQELFQTDGFWYGINQTTKNIITYNRLSGRNYNGLYIGESGSGKSMGAKLEMTQAILKNPDNRVYIIDPADDYGKIAKAYNGEELILSPATATYLNPMDMDIQYDEEESGDPVALKVDYLIAFIEIILGNNQKLNAKARSVVDRCIRNIYRGYVEHMDAVHEDDPSITIDRVAMPTLNSLYHELQRQEEAEAHSVAQVIELYAQGSFASFAHKTNVDTDNRLLVYNIKRLGSGMQALGLHVALNDIWNKMMENHKNGYVSYIYIDEMWMLLRVDSAADFLTKIWKTARHWKGVVNGLVQNPKDLLRSELTRDILNNTSFMMLYAQKADKESLGKHLKLAESQLEYLSDDVPSGTGLLYTGDTVLPFDNRYPEHTTIYQLADTRN